MKSWSFYEVGGGFSKLITSCSNKRGFSLLGLCVVSYSMGGAVLVDYSSGGEEDLEKILSLLMSFWSKISYRGKTIWTSLKLFLLGAISSISIVSSNLVLLTLMWSFSWPWDLKSLAY